MVLCDRSGGKHHRASILDIVEKIMKRIAQGAILILSLQLWGQPTVSQNLIPPDKVYHDGPNEISVVPHLPHMGGSDILV